MRTRTRECVTKLSRKLLYIYRKMEEVEKPAHYTQGPVHCIDAMLSAFGKHEVESFCRLNAFKYLWRSTTHIAGPEQNLRKAIWYMNKSIELSKLGD
jgi:hypothetical protein